MNLEKFIKQNKGKKYLNYTIDKKFAVLFDNERITLFKKINSKFQKKNYYLECDLFENNKFKKWNIINNKILLQNSDTNLLYLTSEIIL